MALLCVHSEPEGNGPVPSLVLPRPVELKPNTLTRLADLASRICLSPPPMAGHKAMLGAGDLNSGFCAG